MRVTGNKTTPVVHKVIIEEKIKDGGRSQMTSQCCGGNAPLHHLLYIDYQLILYVL